MTTDKSTVRPVSSIRYTKSYLKRVTGRLVEITGDENPRDRISHK
jgi:hypothetical protein